MVIEYKCIECNKIYYNKTDYNKHLKRKKKCSLKTNLKNMTLECTNCKKVFTRKDYLKTHQNKFCKNPKFLPQNEIFTEKKRGKEFSCEYCQKKYTRKDNLNRHIENYCKMKNSNENKDTILKDLLNEMKQLKKQILLLENNNNIVNSNNNSNNTINNNILNNQINNHFNLVAFGKEKLDEIIGEEECKKILFRGFEAVPQLVENVHFNKNRPEYHNCYIPNMRTKYAIVYDGNNWKLENAFDVIETLKDNKKDFLERKFDDFYDSLDNKTKEKFNNFLSEADTDVMINRYKERLTLMLYNKKGIVIETRKKFDSQIKINLIGQN